MRSFEPPLKGIKVVDLGRVLAAPYCSMLLSDLGADVIKVEHPTRGDDTRAWFPPSAPLQEHTPSSSSSSDVPSKESPDLKAVPVQDWSKLPPESAYFLAANRGKRSLGVNLKTKEGQDIVRKLIEDADVLVENYVPGKLAEMRLGYEDCKALNPGLIYASISGYGQSGPYSKNPGYDVMIEAEAGLMHITGEKESTPVKVGVAITDLTTGLYAQSAILAALYGRQKTGKGVHIDANLFDAQIASLANIASNYLVAGQEAERQGTAHPSIVPYQTVKTQDGWLMLGAGNDKQFQKLSKLLGRPEWATSTEYCTNSVRVANRKQLISEMTAILTTRPTSEWLTTLTGQGLPFAPINNIQQTFEHPQAVARGLVTEVEHPRIAGKLKMVAPAIQYDGERMPITRPPPVLGQHTLEVLREELGMSDGQIAELHRKGAI